MVAIRFAIQALVAATAAMSARAHSHRDPTLMARGYPNSRSVFDSKTLANLGIRAEKNFRVLVLRSSSKGAAQASALKPPEGAHGADTSARGAQMDELQTLFDTYNKWSVEPNAAKKERLLEEVKSLRKRLGDGSGDAAQASALKPPEGAHGTDTSARGAQMGAGDKWETMRKLYDSGNRHLAQTENMEQEKLPRKGVEKSKKQVVPITAQQDDVDKPHLSLGRG